MNTIRIGIDFYKGEEVKANPRNGEDKAFDLGGFYGVVKINCNEQRLLLPIVKGEDIKETMKKVIITLKALQEETENTIKLLSSQIKDNGE